MTNKHTVSIAGIDYSMTSPAIVVFSGYPEDEWSIGRCRFHYLTIKKSTPLSDPDGVLNLVGEAYPEYSSNEERFYKLARWTTSCVAECARTFLEDYAFAATGRVFHIGENGGVLKNALWLRSIPMTGFTPTQAKKHATGRGNAKKVDMESAFLEQTGVDLRALFGGKAGDSPVSDMVDAYFIAQLGWKTVQKGA